MLHFGQNTEDASRILVPSGRGDEFGTTERELAQMQTELNQLLHQKSRLAALGLAVSKISHDLRNMLSTAQLISDRFGSIPDPTVQRLAPGRWKLTFHVDPRGRDRNDPVGYRPGAWEPLRFQLCGGQLRAEFAQAGVLQMPESAGQASLEIAAQDLELGLKPAP